LRDPQFPADAEAAHLNIKPSSAERVQEAVAKLYAAPPDVVERARELVAASDTRK